MKERTIGLQEVWIRLENGRSLYSKESVSNPGDAVRIMRREMSSYDREVVCVVNLNAANRPINFNMVSMGSISSSVLDTANVLKSCILSNSASFILLHNHPSGNLYPSKEDIESTRRMILAGSLLGIPCVDHIIIGGGAYYSLREHDDVYFFPGTEDAMKGVKAMIAEKNETYQTPFGDVGMEGMDDFAKKPGGENKREEVTLQFGKGLCSFFLSKKGDEMARIKIAGTEYESWPSFVVPARIVHDNTYGKGFWMKLPAEGKTTLSVSRKVTGEDGGEMWQNDKFTVDNRTLKDMVESYKKKEPAKDIPEASPEKARPKKKSR